MININFKLIKIFFYRIIFIVFLILTNSIISLNAFGSSKNFNTNSKIKIIDQDINFVHSNDEKSSNELFDMNNEINHFLNELSLSNARAIEHFKDDKIEKIQIVSNNDIMMKSISEQSAEENRTPTSKKKEILNGNFFNQILKHSISQFSSNQRMVFSGIKDKSINDLMIIPKGGQIGLAGNMNGISFDFERNNIFYSLKYSKSHLSSGLHSNFTGKPTASYDYLNYDMENLAKIDRYSFSLGYIPVESTLSDLLMEIGIAKTHANLNFQNDLKVGFVNHIPSKNYKYDDLGLLFGLKYRRFLSNTASLFIKSDFDIALLETSNLGLGRQSFSVGLGLENKFYSSFNKKKNFIPLKRNNFIEFGAGYNLANLSNNSLVSEDDYFGNVQISSAAGLFGNDLFIKTNAIFPSNSLVLSLKHINKRSLLKNLQVNDVAGTGNNLITSAKFVIEGPGLGIEYRNQLMRSLSYSLYLTSGLNLSQVNLNYLSSTQYGNNSNSKLRRRSNYIASALLGMGLRKNISKNKYIFGETIINYYNGRIVSVPLTIVEYNINFGLGFDF